MAALKSDFGGEGRGLGVPVESKSLWLTSALLLEARAAVFWFNNLSGDDNTELAGKLSAYDPAF